MKADMKNFLKEAFAAPVPVHKKDFLKNVRQPGISTFSFIFAQLSYIRKRVWIMSGFIFILALVCAAYFGEDSIWMISAMIPFIELFTITESVKSTIYNMAELEMSSRFSLKSIVLARLSAIGLLHLVILCGLVIFTQENVSFSMIRTGVYLFVPYLLTSVSGLIAARKVQSKEVIYICMGISIMVSFLIFVLKENIPSLYGEKQFIWWCFFASYLTVKTWSEYKKTIYQTEELV